MKEDSRSPAPPRLKSKPYVLPPGFDVAELPKLIPNTTFKDRFLPWIDPELASEHVPRYTSLPPWSLNMERYYRKFVPYTWKRLGGEYEEQLEYLRAFTAWLEQCERDGTSSSELANLRRERSQIRTYAWSIYTSLYGLHPARERYLDFYRDRPGDTTSDEFIILNTLVQEEGTTEPCSDPVPRLWRCPDHSIWPLPLPKTTIPRSRGSSCPPIVSIAGWPDFYLAEYRLPPFNQFWHLLFVACSIEKYRREYLRAEQDGRIAACRARAKEVALQREEEDLVDSTSPPGRGTCAIAGTSRSGLPAWKGTGVGVASAVKHLFAKLREGQLSLKD